MTRTEQKKPEERDSGSRYQQLRALKLAKYEKESMKDGSALLRSHHLLLNSENDAEKMGYPEQNEYDDTIGFEATVHVSRGLFNELENLVRYSNYQSINGVVEEALNHYFELAINDPAIFGRLMFRLIDRGNSLSEARLERIRQEMKEHKSNLFGRG
ncbi:MAG: hypothetical protein ABI361_02035 [Nitrososphaera sp.]